MSTAHRMAAGVVHTLPADAASLRSWLVDWIASNAPEELSRLTDWSGLTLGANHWWAYEEHNNHPAYRRWEQALARQRLICAGWPVDYGGHGLDAVQSAILDEEFLRANVPRVSREQGEAWVGPAVIAHGDDEQRARLLPRILSGEDRYCQGFSEPDHGSDLAAVQTRGVVDGNVLRIDGQKAWTSGAAYATSLFLLCRTDQQAARHRGLSYVIVPLEGNEGRIDIRPVRQMNGQADFCDVYLDGARTPLSNVIGGLNNGWRVAMTTLDSERGRAAVRHIVYERQFWRLVEHVRASGRWTEPEATELLVRTYIDLQALSATARRALRRSAMGESGVASHTLSKLAASLYHQRFGEVVMDVLGPQALIRPAAAEYVLDEWQRLFLDGRALTIVAGTSEIQRNVIAERILGLPRE